MYEGVQKAGELLYIPASCHRASHADTKTMESWLTTVGPSVIGDYAFSLLEDYNFRTLEMLAEGGYYTGLLSEPKDQTLKEYKSGHWVTDKFDISA